MTDYVYSIYRVMDVLDCIKEHDGMHVTAIAREIEWNAIIPRINEMINYGLAVKRGSWDCSYRVVHLTRKGEEVLEMLHEITDRLKDHDGEDEIVKEQYHRETQLGGE